MTENNLKNYYVPYLSATALAGWAVPGGGYFLTGETKRGWIAFITITATFVLGLYVGSIGVVDPVGGYYWYIAQTITSPIVFLIGSRTAAGGFPVYGKPEEIGQIYTSIAGMLNLLCIVKEVHTAHIIHKYGKEM
jgi:hypothetical protein